MDQNSKSQAVERLRDAQNVLVTVSDNPSVDQLCAAVGLTLMMNKLGKHATAVFSGQVPSTIEFLKPEETLEQNTDSLRDFIIALDKSKADKVRYKVEENVVKIFITPYRTYLTEKDLDFSQGDFNVDVVVALGVAERNYLDKAITAHGRILHDATVIGVMAGPTQVDIGSINWQEPEASGLCEMLVSISEAFQGGLIDSQMATAFLTGIVAQTERFRNEKTTPKVMTMAAQLMAAGANQQLIAEKLELAENKPDEQEPVQPETNPDEEGVIDLHEDKIKKQEETSDIRPTKPEPEEIHIDEQGVLSASSDLKQQEKSENSKQKDDVKEKEKIDENEKEISEYSKYITEAPQTGGVLTANSVPEQERYGPSTDPLSTIPSAVTPPLPTKAADIRPINDNDNFDIGSLENDKKLGPDVNQNDTLADIESNVQSYQDSPQNDLDADAARKAVMNAVNAAYNPDRPEPVQALNATEFPLEKEESDNVAPPVPPPIMPPFSEPAKEMLPNAGNARDDDDNISGVPPLPGF